jgi:hypothetical protein
MILTSSWGQLPLLLVSFEWNINLTILHQSVQLNRVLVNVCVRQSCSTVGGWAVSQVKEGRPGGRLGRSVASCFWVITRGTTPGHYFVCVCVCEWRQSGPVQGFPNFPSSQIVRPLTCMLTAVLQTISAQAMDWFCRQDYCLLCKLMAVCRRFRGAFCHNFLKRRMPLYSSLLLPWRRR